MVSFLLAKIKGMVAYSELELSAKVFLQPYLASSANGFVTNLFKKNNKWSSEYLNWISPRLHRIANSKDKPAQILQLRNEIMGIGEEMNSSYLFLEDKIMEDGQRLSILSEEDRKILATILHPDIDFGYVISDCSRTFAFSEPLLQCLIAVAKRFLNDTDLEDNLAFYLQLHMLLLNQQYSLAARNARTQGPKADFCSAMARLVKEVKDKILQGLEIDFEHVKKVASEEAELANIRRDKALIDWPINANGETKPPIN
jgi:hypothetical protein